jgi:hypothetical protein
MGASPIPDLDTSAVLAACATRLDPDVPGLDAPFRAVLDRLDPARWTLEWHLPWWLGHAFGLRSEVAFELVVSDVLGLASIRLEDDLADGDVAAVDITSTQALRRILYDEALRPYHDRFDRDDPFWERIDAWMGEWRRGVRDDGRDSTDADDPKAAVRRLAMRATPLRIPAYAVCALAGRLGDYETIDRCLDHALAALVLYDHLVDRADDLEAGRWNALVAAVSPLPQTLEHRERNRVALEVALMTSGAADELGRRIEEGFDEAAKVSVPLGCPPLTAYLSESGARARRQSLEVDAHYRGVADEATRLLFGER